MSFIITPVRQNKNFVRLADSSTIGFDHAHGLSGEIFLLWIIFCKSVSVIFSWPGVPA